MLSMLISPDKQPIHSFVVSCVCYPSTTKEGKKLKKGEIFDIIDMNMNDFSIDDNRLSFLVYVMGLVMKQTKGQYLFYKKPKDKGVSLYRVMTDKDKRKQVTNITERMRLSLEMSYEMNEMKKTFDETPRPDMT